MDHGLLTGSYLADETQSASSHPYNGAWMAASSLLILMLQITKPFLRPLLVYDKGVAFHEEARHRGNPSRI